MCIGVSEGGVGGAREVGVAGEERDVGVELENGDKGLATALGSDVVRHT